jgi:hypothetical protein
MLVKVAGLVRGLFASTYPEGDEDKQIVLNNRGDQVVVQSLPEFTELVRLGDSWQVALATGIAALTALPTTAAGLSIWNGEPANGKCYAIDSFGSWEAVTDATQSDRTALFAMNNAIPVAAPTATAITIRSLSGRSNYSGKARPVSALAVTNEGWFAHGGQPPAMTAFAGDNWKVNEVFVRGLYLVPPGGCFSVHAVKAAAAAAAQQFFFVRWHEVQLIWKS